MPVSGLVVSLCDEPRARRETVAELRSEPRISVGVAQGNRLAIVLDTDSSDEDRRMWDWLEALAGIRFLEVVFIGFEDDPAAEQPLSCPSGTETLCSPDG